MIETRPEKKKKMKIELLGPALFSLILKHHDRRIKREDEKDGIQKIIPNSFLKNECPNAPLPIDSKAKAPPTIHTTSLLSLPPNCRTDPLPCQIWGSSKAFI